MLRAVRALVLSFALFQPMIVAAQGTQPNGLPPGVYMGEADYKQAPAGSYAIDPDHASVIARVSHLRYSWSIFRFDKVSGTMKWDPANPANASLTAKVETASITSNVKRFAQELSGNNHLKSTAFPEATFDVELIGAGKGFADRPRIGVSARGTINPVDFGLLPLFGDAIEIVIDVEFQKDA